ncbi:MAG: type VI secretion system tip protein TssI/VgrG [Polyangiales bacterium]
MPGAPDAPDVPEVGAFGSTTEFLVSRPTREPAPEAGFTFSSSALAGVELRVVHGRVAEALDALYEGVLELCAPDLNTDLDALLGARCVLEVARGPRARRFCGVVRRVERLDSWGGRRRARVTFVPAAWALTRRVDSRIFQDRSTPEIVQSVVKDAGLPAQSLASKLTREYPKREYCVQYRESDYHFVARLLEEEGISWHFRHDGEAEVLTLTDSDSAPLCPTLDRRAVPFSPPQSELNPVEVVRSFDFAKELRATGFTARDYDFTRPQAELDLTREHPRGEPGERPRYEFPGRFTLGGYDEGGHAYTTHDGGARAETGWHEEHGREAAGAGTGNVTGFMPGRAFELVGHEHGDLDRRYLLTRVVHHLHAPEVLLAEGDARAAAGLDRYRNEFEATPREVHHVPERRTPRPTVLATQTATVTGPAGEEIHTDFHGRVKVQFHWDRKGARDEKSSCWIRVAQQWAGAGWGFQFIPRVGMEVVVQFIEGDPDRPLVTGCVYNGTHTTPYPLPDEKTRSAIKSSSSPGGGGYNELRFEDLAGREEVYLHAQRDHNEVVERHHTETVRGYETVHVSGHQQTVIDGKGERPPGMTAPGASLRIEGDYNILVTSEYHLQVGTGTARIDSDNNYLALKATGDIRHTTDHDLLMSAKNAAVLKALQTAITGSEKVTLASGNSEITLTPGGIKIKSDGPVEIRGSFITLN